MTPSAVNPNVKPAEDPREFLRHLFDVAVKRALPLENTAACLPEPPTAGRTVVIGAGKAGAAMAQAVEVLWPQDAPLQGLVVTRYHHTPPRPAGLAQRIEVVEAAHPVPDTAGLQAAERMLAMVQGLAENDLVLCLISGGGSALLTLPADGLTLAQSETHRFFSLAPLLRGRDERSSLLEGWGEGHLSEQRLPEDLYPLTRPTSLRFAGRPLPASGAR